MRAVTHSTRTTIRVATVLAATTSLLLALAAGFMGTAHAAGSLPAFDDSPYAGDAAVFQVIKGDLDDFDISQSGKNGNPNCDDLAVILGVTGPVNEVRFGENPPQGSSLSFGDGTTVTLTSINTDSESGWTLYDYAVEGDLEVFAVFLKQSSGGVLFDYKPGTSTGDTGLHSLKADGVVSHISFCAVDAQPGGGDQDPDPVATLKLVKIVDGGSATFSNFTPVVTPANDVTFGFGSEADPAVHDVDPGTYTLSEQIAEGYTLDSIDCGGDVKTAEGETSLEVTLLDGDELTCTFTNVATTGGNNDIIEEEEELIDDEEELVEVEELLEEVTEAPEDVAVLDDVAVADDEAAAVDDETAAVDDETAVLDEVATADELPATGLETLHLSLLAALFAALGVLFLLGTETDKVRVHRA